MRIRLYYIPVLLVFIAALHFGALYTGVYDAQIAAGFVWWDNVLHALVGITFGMAWLRLLDAVGWNLTPRVRAFSTIAVVFALAILWELAELALLLIAPDTAHGLQMYSTSTREATMDSLSNLLGALALIWLLPRFVKIQTNEQFKLPDIRNPNT